MQSESEQVKTLKGEFDATSPDNVSITRHAKETNQSIETVWERLSAWHTARRRVSLLERALATESRDSAAVPY